MLGNARTVVLIGFLSQIFAFTRTAAMAYIFGASIEIDAYNIAVSLPIFVSSLITGWLQASFVGRYIDLTENQGEGAALRYRSMTGLLVLAVLIGMTGILVVARRPLAEVLVPASLTPTHDLTVQALFLAAFILLPSSMSDYLALVLSCHKRFFIASMAPVANAAVSVLALLCWPERGLNALLYSLIIGWAAQLLILIVAAYRGGLGFTARKIELGDELRALIRLFLPILPATFFSNATTLVLQSAFVRMGEGFVSTFGYAQRLNNAMVQVIVIGLSTVLLPHLATLIAKDDRGAVALLFDRIIRAVVVISVLALIMISLLGTDTILMLFGRGRFQKDQAVLVSKIWLVLTACTAPLAISTFFAKLFQALRQPGKLSISSLISFCLTAITCQIGILTQNYLVIAAALGTAQVFVLVYFTMNFRAQFGGHPKVVHFVGVGLFTAGLCLPPAAIELSLQLLGLLPSGNSIATLARGIGFLLIFGALGWKFGILARIQGKPEP